MRAACGRAQMAMFGRREGSLAAGWLADQNAGYSALELDPGHALAHTL
jgi:hypothetical protein